MPFCPNCGSEIGNAQFCPNCGMEQGDVVKTSSPGPQSNYGGGPPPNYQPVSRSGTKYDETICLVLCCCLSPLVALVYYLLTDHTPDYYQQHPQQPPKY